MALGRRMLLASAAVTLIMVGGIAAAGAGTGGGSEDPQIIADAKRTEAAILVAYNDKKWDDLRALYTEDAVLLPPNHDAVRGPEAIVEYYRRVHDVYGEIDLASLEYVRVRASEQLADLVTNFTMQSGVRLVYQGLYERPTDGAVLLGVDHVGFRDVLGQ